MNGLFWLPRHPDFPEALKTFKDSGLNFRDQIQLLKTISNHNLDFVQVTNLDRRLLELLNQHPGEKADLQPIKLAVSSSSTVEHLLPSIRVAGLRRGLLVDCFLGEYNQYNQELMDPSSKLHAFKPDVILLALDAETVRLSLPLNASASEVLQKVEARLAGWIRLWDIAMAQLGAKVIHQTIANPFPQIFGHMDALVPASPSNVLFQINAALRKAAADQGVLLLDMDNLAAHVGRQTWHDPALWHHAKQAVSPAHSPLYGDSVARLLAAIRGLSHKCLVLDLDNTLWGGVIGDDGLAEIELGAGTGRGEAFQAFQAYAKQLKERGVILTVCSKNDESNALLPFKNHPEMILKTEDFAIIMANWEDKASNLERIARHLNIGVDSLVFFDDNPAERALVRQLLPMVAVPEVPEDPAWFVACLSAAGYFEAVAFTEDDQKRTAQYISNAKRIELQEKSGQDLAQFLKNLQMEMPVSAFDEVGIARITQLINKSNQFNLTTRRYTEAQVRLFMQDPEILTFQIRLKDVFGDNGMISVVIGRPIPGSNGKGCLIDTWLMSCRVLGRQVQNEVLNIMVEHSRRRGFEYLIGEFTPTAKNGLVRDHYQSLGFQRISEGINADHPERTLWRLDINNYSPFKTHITTRVDEGVTA